MKPVALDDFCNLKFLSDISFSPDGNHACYVLSEAVKKENRYNSFLYVLRNGKNEQLTAAGNEESFCWLNNNTILFRSNRDKAETNSLKTNYYQIHLSGGEATLAYSFPIPVEKLIPLKNGDMLVLGTVYPGFEELYTGDHKIAASFQKERCENEDYEVITQMPWWWNGSTFSRGTYSGLYYYSAKKKALTWLTPKGYQVSDVKLSEDQKTVYYSLMQMDIPRPAHFGGENLYRMDLKTQVPECICKSRPDFVIASYELGKTFLLIIAADGKYGINTDPDFYRLDYSSLDVTPYALYGESIGSSICTDIRMSEEYHSKMVGDTFYFVSTRFDSAGLYKLENGVISCVIERDGSVDCFDVHEDKILMVALWDMRAQELYNERGKKMTSFNDKAIRGKYIAKPEILNCISGGETIHGFVLKPINFEAGKKYPVILDVHGGPKCAYGPVLFHEMAYWTGLGYFVIYCNPTGSDGRGAFMNILGKYGTVDYDDIMAFCDAALNTYPEMDASNFFETGGSYGGFMTNWIIGHTNRFKACVSQRSISNWLSFYGVSDIGVDFSEDQNAASLWPSTDKMWWHSPLKYADKVSTPTLFIHAFEDYRCPIDQGYQMYSALVAHGVETKMVLFRGENHELSRSGKPKHRIKRLIEITQWFEKHKS